MKIPYNPDALVGDPDYRPGPDWPPSVTEIAFSHGMSLEVWMAGRSHPRRRHMAEDFPVPEYLYEVPETVPEGKIVVHNQVLPSAPDGDLGDRGFRAWLDSEGTPRIACGCGWAPHLPEHYRVSA